MKHDGLGHFTPEGLIMTFPGLVLISRGEKKSFFGGRVEVVYCHVPPLYHFFFC